MKNSQSKYIILLTPHYFQRSDLSMGSDHFRVYLGSSKRGWRGLALLDQSDVAHFFTKAERLTTGHCYS